MTRILLLLAAIAPLVLAYIIARDHALSWPRGELTPSSRSRRWPAPLQRPAVRPGTSELAVGLKYGWYLAALGSAADARRLGRPVERRRAAAQAPRHDLTPRRPMTEHHDLGRPDRNLALELVRTTEAAALAAAGSWAWATRSPPTRPPSTRCASCSRRVPMDGVVVIGEGEKDEAPTLYNGEQIGDGSEPRSTSPWTAGGHDADREGHAERAERHRHVPAGHDVRPRARASTWRSWPARRTSPTCSTSTARSRETLRLIAERKRIAIRDVMVVVLDRPRHEDGIREIRDAGARVRLIADGDVCAALLAVVRHRPWTCCGASAARRRASSPRRR